MKVLAHWKPIVAAVLLGLGVGIAYLLLAEDRYAAEAKLQVVPIPAEDRTFDGFALPRVSDEASAAETVADLVERPSVVDPAAVQLRLDREDVLDAVTLAADDRSNVVAVRAEAADPQQAAQIANAVAEEFVAERSGAFQGELNRTIAQLREELRDVPASRRDVPPAEALVARLTALRALQGERDPTVRVAGNAESRDRVVWPRPAPVLATALLGSLLLGLAVAALMAAAGGRPATRPTDDSLVQREAELGERVRAVTKRERTLARSAGELAARERELERLAEVQASTLEPEPEPEPEPTRFAPAGAWNLGTLERLVAERGSEFPERAEEWQAYLFLLREHASLEGELPRSFDALVDETFHELLG